MPDAPLVIPWANPRYVVFRDKRVEDYAAAHGEPLIVHIATPAWMLTRDGVPNPRCLFIVHADTICGSCGAVATAKRAGYVTATWRHGVFGLEYFTAIPEGYVLCAACAARIRREFMPYAPKEKE